MVKETNTKRHCAVAVIRICSGPPTTYIDGFFLLFFSVAEDNHAVRFRISFSLSLLITRLYNGESFFIFTKQQTVDHGRKLACPFRFEICILLSFEVT